MWTKWRRSGLLLIEVQRCGGRKLTIPVSLTAIEQLLRAVLELTAVIGSLFPARIVSRLSKNLPGSKFSLAECLKFLQEFWTQIRSYGSWKLVEVETDEVKVMIRFF